MNARAVTAGWIGCAAVLAGCAVGPDYHAPAPVAGSSAPLLGTTEAQATATHLRRAFRH